MNNTTTKAKQATKPANRIQWQVSFLCSDNGEELYANCACKPSACRKFETSQRSPKRAGRPVLLSEVEYAQDVFGDWVCVRNNQIDGA